MAEQNMNRNEEWMTAYKLMRLGKDGGVYPLFINRKERTRFNEILKAECYPTKGFAVRCGWHCCFIPYAPHLKETLSSGEERVWVEVMVRNWESYDRPESQGGAWILAQEMVAVRKLNEQEVDNIRNKKIA